MVFLYWHGHRNITLYVYWIHLSLRWRYNGRDSVSNHQPHDCLLNRLFRRRSKKTSKLRVTGLCAHKWPVTRKMFPFDDVIMWYSNHQGALQILRPRPSAQPLHIICMLAFNVSIVISRENLVTHDDVVKWKHFPRYWPFVRGIHRSTVNSLHKGQWRGALMFSLICAWINGRVNNYIS